MKVYLPASPRPADKKKLHDGRIRFTEAHALNTLEDALALNRFDSTCILFQNGYRKGDYFMAADSLYLDFDHVATDEEGADGLRDAMEGILEKVPYRGIAVPSSSLHGFHFFIPLDRTVTDKDVYKKTYSLITRSVPGADPAVKDFARYAFASVIDPDVFASLVMVKKEGDRIDVDAALRASRRPAPAPSLDLGKFDIVTEGGRNNNTYRLACSILSKASNEEEAREIFENEIAGSTLPDSEKESCWASALSWMESTGSAFAFSPAAREEKRVAFLQEKPEDGDELDAIACDPGFCDIRRRFIELSGEFNIATAKKAIETASPDDFNTSSKILKMAQARLKTWSLQIVNPRLQAKLGYRITQKNAMEIGARTCEYWQTKEGGVAWIPELTEWVLCDPKTRKWERTDDRTAKVLIEERLAHISELASLPGCHDEMLIKVIDSALNSIYTKSSTASSMATVSYSQFQNNSAYRVATPKGLFSITKDGITKTPIRPSDNIMSTATVSPEDEAPKEVKGLFAKFLTQIVPKKENRDWLQTVLGAQLLGKPDYQRLFIWQGEASNGKSTLFNAVMEAIGDYGGYIRPEAFSASALKAEEFDRELAKLLGKRIVLAQEPKEGLGLDPGRTKVACSTDRLTASRKYVNPFDFPVTHTCNLICNQAPVIGNSDDQGLVRRLTLFKFTETFKGKAVDPTLPAKLSQDKPEILSWLLEGAVKYLSLGRFPENEDVDRWTEEYVRVQDDLASCLDDLFIKDDSWGTSPMAIASAYNDWASCLQGRAYISAKVMGGKLQKKGFAKKQIVVEGKRVWVYTGLRLNTQSEAYKLIDARKYRNDGLPYDSYRLPSAPADPAPDEEITDARCQSAGFKDRVDLYAWLLRKVVPAAQGSRARLVSRLDSLQATPVQKDLALMVFDLQPHFFKVE